MITGKKRQEQVENSNWDFLMEVPSRSFYSWLWYRWLIEIDDKNKMVYLQKNVTFIDVP